MKYLIIGKNGQLGKEFSKDLENKKADFLSLGHDEIDITKNSSVFSVVDSYKPDIVINCSAYNQVDLAEKDFETAYKTNSLGVYNLTLAQEKHNFFIVHYGTDYVFDGEKKDGLYNENDLTNPLSQYAKSKLMGESFLNNNPKSLVFRVSWVFGQGNQNFIYKLKQWSNNSNNLKISCDEVSTPTSAKTITDITFKSLEKGLTGLFHLNNSGYCSRHEYAKYVMKVLKNKTFLYPSYANEFNLPAKRPRFSAMDNNKISNELNIEIETWEDAVKSFLII
ncbi:MAG: dTDP-4-dehydrorhamnose reductase [Cyanobacteriota bacterium]